MRPRAQAEAAAGSGAVLGAVAVAAAALTVLAVTAAPPGGGQPPLVTSSGQSAAVAPSLSDLRSQSHEAFSFLRKNASGGRRIDSHTAGGLGPNHLHALGDYFRDVRFEIC